MSTKLEAPTGLSNAENEKSRFADPKPTGNSGSNGKLSLAMLGLVVVVLSVLGWAWARRQHATAATGGPGGGSRAALANLPVPIIPGVVELKDVPIYLDGLGTVQAFNTVTVRSRVDGQINGLRLPKVRTCTVGRLACAD